jgi:FixJ family two-component response regulator
MTGFGDRDMRTKAMDLGARKVVDKPFRVAEFVALVESAVGQ